MRKSRAVTEIKSKDDLISVSRDKTPQIALECVVEVVKLPIPTKVYHNSFKMNENTKNILNHVVVKLYSQMLNGLNLQIHEHKWEFDWDEDLPLEENLNNCESEERGLDVLTQLGVIKSERKENYIKAQHEETYHIHAPNSIWEEWDNLSPAKREYNFIRYVDSVNLEKFYAFCAEHDINYLEKRVEAILDVTDQIPSVQIEDKKHYLKVLKDGMALSIIEAARTHYDEKLSASRLRLLMGKPNLLVSQKNFKQIFRSNVFGEDNVLHPFVEISTDAFMLKKRTSLTPKELIAIQKASTN